MKSHTCLGLTLSLTLLAVAWPGAALAGDAKAADQPTVFVRLDFATMAEAGRQGLSPARTIDYGTFSIVELSATDAQRAAAAGLLTADAVLDYTLTFGESRFDPLVEAPAINPQWASQRAAGNDLRLVQFVGPTKQEWLDDLARAGLEVVQYFHPYTYAVYGPAEAAADVRAAAGDASPIRWTGDYLPGYKVQPRWQALADDAIMTTVMIYKGADVGGTIEAINAMGGKFAGVVETDPVFAYGKLAVPGQKYLDIASMPGVYSIQPEPTDGGLRGEMSNQVCVNNVDGTNLAYPGYFTWLAGVGVNGAGVRIANVDGGVQQNHPDLVNRIVPCVGVSCSASSSSHGTHTAGIMAADSTSGTMDGLGFRRGLGIAPGANLVVQNYSPTFTQPGGMLLLMTISQRNGASLSGNSWGPAGTPRGYDGDTRQTDVGVRDADPDAGGNQPLSFVLSIMNGNGGTSTQGTPDEAKNLFTIGSTKMQNTNGTQILEIDDLSSNTAHGPCLDGRKIPHMVAPGCRVDSSYTTSTYSLLCGTSMASPHVSGAVAVFIEYYRGLPDYTVDPSPAMVKAAFLPVARNLKGKRDANNGILGSPFDSKQGWGRMELQKVVDPQESVLYFDNPVTFDNTGEEWVRAVSAEDPSKPIKIMLVWTDAPGHGNGGSTPAWNNNLDLTVEDGANVYKGNVFNADGWSITGGAADDRNNTEGVFIGPTAPGGYVVKVAAANINSDGVPNQGDGTDQDFAVACYNCAQDPSFILAASPSPQVICAPSDAVINVNVGSIMGYADPVTLSVSGNPAGTNVSIVPNPVTPVGSATVTVSNTGAAAAGSYNVQIDGVSGAINRSVVVPLDIYTAAPDAPTLAAPANGVTNQALRPNFSWNVPAQGVSYTIEVASDAGMSNIVQSASGLANPSWTPAADLASDTTYFWRVRSTNPCGTGGNSPVWSFTTRSFPQILLVDDDDNGPDVRSYYTAALNGLGRSYDVFNTNNNAIEPTAAEISPYRIIIWFSGDSFGGTGNPKAGPSAASEVALAAWLDTGKRLWIVSQDYLYDRGQTTFMTNYLGLASFTNDVNQTSVTGQNALFNGYGPYALSYPFSNFSDRISPNATALVAFNGTTAPPETAIYKETQVYKTVFFSFPLEAIPAPANREAVMQRVLDWFAPQCGLKGDLNGDTYRDGRDLQQFVDCVIANDAYAPGCACADLDSSGDLSSNDRILFVDCLLGNGCP
jgi:serine protease AprX